MTEYQVIGVCLVLLGGALVFFGGFRAGEIGKTITMAGMTFLVVDLLK